jgi:hypothetical protein
MNFNVIDKKTINLKTICILIFDVFFSYKKMSQNVWATIMPFVITFLTTLTPLARVVLRNDASPWDGDNKRLVCVRGDQCHDHIKDIRKREGPPNPRETSERMNFNVIDKKQLI